MRAWVLYGINDIRYEEVPDKIPGHGQALLRVRAAGICGSDIPRIFTTGAHRHPLIPGHEFAGEVVETGDAADNAWIGKRAGVFPLISCNRCRYCMMGHPELCRNYDYLGSRSDGGFAEYALVPVTNLVDVGDGVSFQAAAMMEPMAVAVHAIRQAGIIGASNEAESSKDSTACKTAAVIGFGTIGLLTAMFIKDAGIGRILLVGNKDIQKEKALDLGFESSDFCDIRELKDGNQSSDWIKEKTGEGADYIFECVGTSDSLVQAISAAAPFGTVVTVGNPAGDMDLNREVYWKILRNQLKLVGTWNSIFTDGIADDWGYVLERLKSGSANPEALISHRLELDELMKGFEIMKNKSEPYIKVIFQSKE